MNADIATTIDVLTAICGALVGAVIAWAVMALFFRRTLNHDYYRFLADLQRRLEMAARNAATRPVGVEPNASSTPHSVEAARSRTGDEQATLREELPKLLKDALAANTNSFLQITRDELQSRHANDVHQFQTHARSVAQELLRVANQVSALNTSLPDAVSRLLAEHTKLLLHDSKASSAPPAAEVPANLRDGQAGIEQARMAIAALKEELQTNLPRPLREAILANQPALQSVVKHPLEAPVAADRVALERRGKSIEPLLDPVQERLERLEKALASMEVSLEDTANSLIPLLRQTISIQVALEQATDCPATALPVPPTFIALSQDEEAVDRQQPAVKSEPASPADVSLAMSFRGQSEIELLCDGWADEEERKRICDHVSDKHFTRAWAPTVRALEKLKANGATAGEACLVLQLRSFCKDNLCGNESPNGDIAPPGYEVLFEFVRSYRGDPTAENAEEELVSLINTGEIDRIRMDESLRQRLADQSRSSDET